MTISNSIFLKALNKEKLLTPPIWYMRQAGRYMPEYRAVRKGFKNFLDMCKDPDVCCELALQPMNKFELDASILFSDILTIPDAMDLKVKFLEGEGPVFDNPIRNAQDVHDIEPFDADKLSYVYQAVSNIRSALPRDIPLIGFCGSPWTLAAYSIEGRSSKDFSITKKFIENNNAEAHIFLQKLTDACFIYLREQVKAGADVIQIFDSWANLLNESDYQDYSLNYISSLIASLKNDPVTSSTPIILFAREPRCSTEIIVNTNTDCLSLYWSMEPKDFTYLSGKVSLQGNLNPKILLESNDIIKRETYKILDAFEDYPGYIFNLGHGITPDIDPAKVSYLTDIIRER